MIDALRTVRRPAPGFAWRALALHVGPALLLAATVLPTALLLGRLPRYLEPPFQHHPANYLAGAESLGLWLVAGWAVAVVADRTSRQPNRRMLWELWVPLLYGLGGYVVAFTTRSILLDLDRPFAPRSAPTGPFELPAIFVAILACAAIGLLLGRRAAATEPVPRPRSRAVWISDVDADRSWWLLQGGCASGACVLLAVPSVVYGSWGAAGQMAAGVLTVFVVLGAWASRGHVSISPSGIRVHYGHVALLGWQLPIDQIASAEVGRIRLLRSWAAWRCLSNLALRDGPALIVRTRAGGRRVVTVADPDDAAAVLGAWLVRHQATG